MCFGTAISVCDKWRLCSHYCQLLVITGLRASISSLVTAAQHTVSTMSRGVWCVRTVSLCNQLLPAILLKRVGLCLEWEMDRWCLHFVPWNSSRYILWLDYRCQVEFHCRIQHKMPVWALPCSSRSMNHQSSFETRTCILQMYQTLMLYGYPPCETNQFCLHQL